MKLFVPLLTLVGLSSAQTFINANQPTDLLTVPEYCSRKFFIYAVIIS